MTRENKIAKTATEALKMLWETGFFRDWKKNSEIVASLANRGNHFSGAELGMALMRAKHLTRRGLRGSYEYIQKYPFAAETGASRGHQRRKKEAGRRKK